MKQHVLQVDCIRNLEQGRHCKLYAFAYKAKPYISIILRSGGVRHLLVPLHACRARAVHTLRSTCPSPSLSAPSDSPATAGQVTM